MRGSLQDKKYVGGLHGARGYEFEKSYILSQLPDWLASDDFQSFQQELWSDLELFFASGRRWLVQIKNHTLELGELRGIFADFRNRHAASQGQYDRFVIVATGASNSVREIQNIIDRWRSIEHLAGSELEATRLHALDKFAEFGFSEVAEFLLLNSNLLHLITDAGWIKNEETVRRIFSSTMSANYQITLHDAERLYFNLAQKLAAERGKLIEAASLREVLQAISLPTESSASSVPFVLPQLDTLTFTGRDDELDRLEKLILTEADSRVCSIVGVAGSGGIGKSALACHFAELHRDRFPEGVIGLRVDGKDNEAVAREFARISGEEIKLEDERDAATIMQERFSHRRMLLIFDNAEDAAMQSLRPGGHKCAVIITTRDRQLPGLLGVPEAGQIDLPPLLHPDSVALLEQLIGTARVRSEPESADQIIGLVGGLPLALQIVGASLQMQMGRSLASYAASLREERARLERLRVQGVAHLDVRASFSLSLRLLEETTVDFFACLSVCAQDGFSLDAAMAAGACEEFNAHERLGHLYRLSLLNRPQLGTNRFVFHPLIRLFAAEIAAERSLKDGAASGHAGFFVRLVKSSDLNNEETTRLLATELDDIVIAAEWLQHQQIPDYGFVIHLEPFLQRNGHWKQAKRLMSGFLSLAELREEWGAVVQLRIQEAKYLSLAGAWREAEAALQDIPGLIDRLEAPDVKQKSEAMFLNTQGGVLQRLGRFSEAADVFRRSSIIEEELGNVRGQAKVLNSLGSVLQRQGYFDEAVNAFRRSAEIEQQLSNKRGQAMTLNSLGGVLQRQGHFDEAVKCFQSSYELLIEVADPQGQAMVLNSLGGTLQRLGRFDEAVETLQRSAEIEELLGNQRGQAIVLNSLGGVFQRQGKFDEAIEALKRSAEIEDRIGNQRGQAMVLNSLGGVFQRQGRFDEAVDAFQRSYEISDRLKDDRSQAMVLNSLGGVFQRQGRFNEAVDAFQRSHALLVQANDQRGQAMVLNSLGGVFQRLGRFNEAVGAFQRSYEISEGLRDDRSLAMVLNSLGGVYQRQGRFDEAIDAFQRSYEISERSKDDRSLAMVLNSLGGVFQRQGRFDEAVDAFQRSYEISDRLKDDRSLAMVLNSLGGVFQRQGRFDEAVDAFQRSYEISERSKDDRSLAMVLNSLGGVFQRQGRFDEAVDAFQHSYEISDRLKDDRSLAMVLNSLGGVFQRQGKFDEAVDAFHRSYELLVQRGDRRGQAMVLNSLAVLHDRMGNPRQAIEAFEHSLRIGEALNDRRHLAMAHTSFGRTLLNNGDPERAAAELGKAFAFEESIKSRRGIQLVTPLLIKALNQIGRSAEADDYMRRALMVAPSSGTLPRTQDNVSSSRLFEGTIKRVIRHQKGHRFGFVTPAGIEEFSKEIYFHERDVLPESLPAIGPGVRVNFEVGDGFKGPQAKRIKIIR